MVSEIAARVAADTGLSNALDTEEAALVSEIAARVAADTGLSNAIDAEETARLAAIQWDSGTKVLQIGSNVKFKFEDYTGFSADDPIQMEIVYKA